MYLGLDLRGRVHFLLQVDMKAALDKAADRYTTDIRSLLREKKVVYAGVARGGPMVVRSVAADRDKARTDIELAFPDLILRDADAPGGYSLVAGLKPEAQKKIQERASWPFPHLLAHRGGGSLHQKTRWLAFGPLLAMVFAPWSLTPS